MKRYEKRAFWKFFLIYFLSVASLILVAGFFYFEQSKAHLLKNEEFSLMEFARHIKMGGAPREFPKEYSYRLIPYENHYIPINNFKIEGERFVKIVPLHGSRKYLEVSKPAHDYEKKVKSLEHRIWTLQFLLLLIFGLLSYRLAKNAIEPLEESIDLLDRFAKDLIHDLNTPVTSIRLNLTLLEQMPCLKDSRVLQRLQKSVRTISELEENLTILLEEKSFQMERANLCRIVYEVVQIQKPLCPDISFILECRDFSATVNPKALKQILQNIISNACRYNHPGGYVKIYSRGHSLIIEDSGKGIEEPEKVFERNHSGSGSSGIGLDIVKRLAMEMQIGIDVERNENGGTRFILTMR